jgi:F0F1-type ATP synthase delta subunit
MSTPSSDYARAAVAALVDALKADGHSVPAHELLDLLTKAVEERSGTLIVTITTPSGESGALKDTVKAAIEKKTGKKVTVQDRADKHLIGGAIVAYGDQRIDLSVGRALLDAKHLLASS